MRASALKRGIHNPCGPLSCVGVCFSACLTSRKRPPRWGSNRPPCRLCPVRDCRFVLRINTFWSLFVGKLSHLGLHRRRKPVSRIVKDPKRFEPKPVAFLKGCRGQERRKRRCCFSLWVFGSFGGLHRYHCNRRDIVSLPTGESPWTKRQNANWSAR